MLGINSRALIGVLSLVLLSACGRPATSIPSTSTAPVTAAGGYTNEEIERVIRKELAYSNESGSGRPGLEIEIEKLPTKNWYKFACDFFEHYEPEHKIVRYHAKGICYMSTKNVKLTTLGLY